MRDIKFRGLRVDGKGWVYGSLISKEGYSAIIIFDKEHDIYNDYLELEVEPESVGQFTGLKDKNGVDIYEGDIVRRIETWHVKEFFGVVKYEHLEFRANNFKTKEWDSVLDYQESIIEVIGNIHENKDLRAFSRLDSRAVSSRRRLAASNAFG